MNPEVDDIIIITDPELSLDYGKTYLVTRFEPSTGLVWAAGIENQASNAFFKRHRYQILEKPGVEVIVGDRVIITRRDWMSDYLRVPVVREVRGVEGFLLAAYEDPDEDVGKFRLSNHEYRILKRGSSTPSSSCPDCNGTGEIELFTSTVKCHCSKRLRV